MKSTKIVFILGLFMSYYLTIIDYLLNHVFYAPLTIYVFIL